MYRTQEKVATSFLVDDANDLIASHHDLIASYRDALEKARSDQLRRLFQALLEDHRADITRLSAVVNEHGGEPTEKPDAGQLTARLRVIFGNLLSEAGMVRAMLTGENKLLQEYTRAIRNLVDSRGLAAALEANRLATQTRIARLEVAIGMD